MEATMNSNVCDVKTSDDYEKILKVFLRIKPRYEKDRKKIIIKCFCDVLGEGEERRIYSVYRIDVESETFVLKKTEENEVFIYETFLEGKNLSVPKMFGHTVEDEAHWILIEYVRGEDLKKFSERIALNSADSLSKIFNMYWMEERFDEFKLDERFDRYYGRITKRAECLKNDDKLAQAYKIFLKRQLTCPRTLCNGDLMQVNGIDNEARVVIIDWSFAGIMPYSLDIARLIAHGAEKDDPLYMTDELRTLFTSSLYHKLNKTALTYDQYCMDIKLAMLNECIEFIEYNLNNPGEKRGHYYDYYFNRANKLAGEILAHGK